MRQVGHVAEIWRYPVKGMGGERLTMSALDPCGLHGDRTWALRDVQRAEVQSCKTRPALLRCNARRRGDDSGAVDIAFPHGTSCGSDDPAIHDRLSAWVGHASTLEALRPPSEIDFYRRFQGDGDSWRRELEATFAREAGEPLPTFLHDVPPESRPSSPRPARSFVTPLHLVTTATLDYLHRCQPTADWDARRFRPNLLIRTGPALLGLVEQAWLGQRLAIGTSVIDCVDTTPRCGAVTRAQAGLEADSSVLRTIVNEADQNVGIYATIAATGRVREGDPVYLVD